MEQNISIKGLSYYPSWFSIENQERIEHFIESQPWLTELCRRVQHYGYKYDYKTRSRKAMQCLGELPLEFHQIIDLFSSQGLCNQPPNQVIINEYTAGQGIAKHVDCIPCFGDTILIISLGSASMMRFQHVKNKQRHELILEPNSLLILQAEARYDWTHEIPKRKTDLINGKRQARERRVSLTFRFVPEQKPSESLIEFHRKISPSRLMNQTTHRNNIKSNILNLKDSLSIHVSRCLN